LVARGLGRKGPGGLSAADGTLTIVGSGRRLSRGRAHAWRRSTHCVVRVGGVFVRLVMAVLRLHRLMMWCWCWCGMRTRQIESNTSVVATGVDEDGVRDVECGLSVVCSDADVECLFWRCRHVIVQAPSSQTSWHQSPPHLSSKRRHFQLTLTSW
jgi:hypothetical protein